MFIVELLIYDIFVPVMSVAKKARVNDPELWPSLEDSKSGFQIFFE